MSELLLHHYPASPYAEKIRAVLGYKGLAWRSVIIPPVMPKPDLMPLTGGYRKTPVLQVGRDVICDSSLIVRVLDRLHPAPAVVPAAERASCQAWAALETTLFYAAIATTYVPAGLKVFGEKLGAEAMSAFVSDRKALYEGGTARRPHAEFGRLHFLPLLHAIDLQLADGRPFLLGAAPTLADFVAYHPAWFVRSNAGVAATLDPLKHVLAWLARLAAFGHGQSTATSATEALAMAAGCRSWLDFDGPLLEPEGITLGQSVVLRATDYGVDPVAGTLVHASVFELVVQREDARAGTVRVHVPRSGFSIVPTQTH